jgi:hypothetical protein
MISSTNSGRIHPQSPPEEHRQKARLAQVQPGIDFFNEAVFDSQPDFYDRQGLIKQIE